MQAEHAQELFDKIIMLPPEKMAMVEAFIEFLRTQEKESELIKWAGRLSSSSFAKVWDNLEDAEYDNL